MDKMKDSGSLAVGSIPAGGAVKNVLVIFHLTFFNETRKGMHKFAKQL